MLYRFLSLCGPRLRRIMFSFWYIIFAALTILPTFLYYRYFWLHVSFVIAIILTSMWNGANFYIEVFSRRYEGNVLYVNYVCMYVSMYVCMYECMYVSMYVCMYV